MTKAEEVFTKVEQLVVGGKSKAEAFKQLAEEYGQPVDSLRGAYYSHKSKTGGGSRPRRRETRPQDAFDSVRTTLERSIVDIDREVEVARERADEATAEYEYLRDHADERKSEIQERLDAWRALDAEKDADPAGSTEPASDDDASSSEVTAATPASPAAQAKKPAPKGAAKA